MDNRIKILDCTLRDGGYVNNWEFSQNTTKSIINSLLDSGVEIIECGFVSSSKGVDIDSTQFKELSQINSLIQSLNRDITDKSFCVMINKGGYDIGNLPSFEPTTDIVKGIRYAFHKKDWREALGDVQLMIEKGYEVYVQAMVTLSYSDLELIEMIEEINKHAVYAAYIVDSFGAMYGDDFRRLHYLFEHNLRKEIRLGYHSHNNLQLAYSNAIDFIQIRNNDREIILDSSIHGMGRGAGNLTTELVSDYLNKRHQTDYNIVPLLDSIDHHLEAEYKENYWGYSIAHFLSASFGCHPNYSSYLVDTKTLSIVDMQNILSKLDENEKVNYNVNRIQELYLEYKSSSATAETIEGDIFRGQKVLILASGSSVDLQKSSINKFINKERPLVVAVNYFPTHYSPNYCFFTNQKRVNQATPEKSSAKVVITSNIKENSFQSTVGIVDYHKLVVMTSNQNDNVTILLLNLLIQQGADRVYLAGVDGYSNDHENYIDSDYDWIMENKVLEAKNQKFASSLEEIGKKINIKFITDSIFEIKKR
jgi:4-hydroxy 2-oxovalerate aldolase